MMNSSPEYLSAVLKAQMQERIQDIDLPESVEDWPPEWQKAYEALLESEPGLPEEQAQKETENFLRLMFGLRLIKQWRKETQ